METDPLSTFTERYASLLERDILKDEAERTNRMYARRSGLFVSEEEKKTPFYSVLMNVRYYELNALFGEPEIVDGSDMAKEVVWKNPQFQIRKFTVEGRALGNIDFIKTIALTPPLIPQSDHVEFLYVQTYIDLSEEREGIKMIDSITASMRLDTSTGSLHARCHFLGAGFAMLCVAAKLALGLYPDINSARVELKALVKKLYGEHLSSHGGFDVISMGYHRTVLDFLMEVYGDPSDIERKRQMYESQSERRGMFSLRKIKGGVGESMEKEDHQTSSLTKL